MRTLLLLLTCLLGAFALVRPAAADVDVVASIKPVHSLVAAVMQRVGEPHLLVEGAASPHGYTLKPSQARLLQQADLIFWVGPNLETFLEKPVETIAKGGASFELLAAPGLQTLSFAHEDGHSDHQGTDPHVWLDPENAKALVSAIETALAKADPDNASDYEANARELTARIDGLETEIAADLKPVRQEPFVVFHDGYRYFVHRFGLAQAGALSLTPEIAPGAQHVGELRKTIETARVKCVFSEPEFESGLVRTLIAGTGARTAVLDPLGAQLAAGPDLYFGLMRAMEGSFRDCLSES